MNFDPPVWFVEWAESVSFWTVLLWVVGVVGVVVWLVKVKPWEGVVAFAHGILHWADVAASVQGLREFMTRTDEALARQDTQIAEIHHEVHYNNGSSVKDSQKRTEDMIRDEVLPKLQALADEDNRLWESIERTGE